MFSKTGRSGDWFCTYTGVQFYLTDPHPDDVRIEDIAHALSMICRFGGHVREFYSVAQHLVHCAEEADKMRMGDYKFQLDTLLHDASEAYIGDIVRPLKYSMPEYLKLEDRTMEVIYTALGLQQPEVDALEDIKQIDDALLLTERNELLEHKAHDWSKWHKDVKPLVRGVSSWMPSFADYAFLERFTFLRAKVASTA